MNQSTTFLRLLRTISGINELLWFNSSPFPKPYPLRYHVIIAAHSVTHDSSSQPGGKAFSQLSCALPQVLEQRKQEALAVAKQCESILRDRFHAEQVILFGSLAGESLWHQNSDLDLAVAGLSQADWLRAYDDLEAIAPDWLKIDLVRLESLYPEVRARVLQEKPMPRNPYLALKEHLQDELVALA